MSDHHAHAHAEPHVHAHHHHHQPGHAHPPAALQSSILRLSVAERLGIAGVVVALIWAAVLWVIQ